MFAFFRRQRRRRDLGRRLYAAVREQARHPALYGADGAPDTVRGRFELICLHGALLVRRLNTEGEAGRDAAQLLFDALFRDLDEALREIGVGDAGVGKRVRRMAEAFYGRLRAYGAALDAGDRALLSGAIARNVLDAASSGPVSDRLADYALAAETALKQAPAEQVLQAGPELFPAP